MHIAEESNDMNYRNKISKRFTRTWKTQQSHSSLDKREEVLLGKKGMLNIPIKEMELSTHTSLFVTGCMNFM